MTSIEYLAGLIGIITVLFWKFDLARDAEQPGILYIAPFMGAAISAVASYALGPMINGTVWDLIVPAVITLLVTLVLIDIGWRLMIVFPILLVVNTLASLAAALAYKAGRIV